MKMRRLLTRKGQSTLEYAILIAVVVGGLITMQTYVKRAIQGRAKNSADDIGSQYSPGYVESTFTTETTSTTTETALAGVTKSDTTTSQKRSGTETVAPLEQEYWPE